MVGQSIPFARLGQATHTAFQDICPPFSNFQFIDNLLGGECSAVRRLFSLARREDKGQTLILEDIDPVGAVRDEITELYTLFPGYQCTNLKRLTFWSRSCAKLRDMRYLTEADLLGYAILKQDSIPAQSSKWHIFESVFKKYDDPHNCVPNEPVFAVQCGSQEYHLNGVLYCQQNGLNKSCAQVALRSLLSRILRDQDICYSRINKVVQQCNPDFVPGEGLESSQIRIILESFGIKYDDIDYIATNKSGVSQPIPYSKVLYAGIENGLGGLLGFELSTTGVKGDKHIIPFYGHTFNQDTWVPRASIAYFRVGDSTRYISSEEWMSSLIGHDDNFGSNYCVPRRYIEPSQVKYVVALRPPNTAYSAISAEAIAADCLYSTLNTLEHIDAYWIQRLIYHINSQDVVLRTLYVNRNQYVAHLRESADWKGLTEDTSILDNFASSLPEHLWMVEVSIPELFPANYRKLGEIILDACVSLDPFPPKVQLWILARLPGLYLINQSPIIQGPTSFMHRESAMKSHIPLYRGLNATCMP